MKGERETETETEESVFVLMRIQPNYRLLQRLEQIWKMVEAIFTNFAM